jgi:hypothetical protein
MALRTYLPGFVLALRTLHRYATRYQTQISAVLTAPQLTCFLALITALAECLNTIVPPEPV